MDRNNARHTHPKSKKLMPSHASTHKPSLTAIALISLGCGLAILLLILSLFSVLMMQIDLPREVLHIPALLSVCMGALASAATASRFVTSSRLVCGVFCGIIYFVILEACIFAIRGGTLLDTTTVINAGVLLLSGAAGGVLSAMNPNSRRGGQG